MALVMSIKKKHNVLHGHVVSRWTFAFFCQGFHETNERLCCHASHFILQMSNLQWSRILEEHTFKFYVWLIFRIRFSPSDSPQRWGSASWLAFCCLLILPPFFLRLSTPHHRVLTVVLFLVLGLVNLCSVLSSRACLTGLTWAVRRYPASDLAFTSNGLR